MIYRKEEQDAKVYGLTIPLMLKVDGTKFDKSAGGAIWLDPKKTSPYEFYPFWLNQDDRDIVKYLKYFTFLSHDEINALATSVKTRPEKREAQRALAREVTKFVHGEDAMLEAEKISQILFSGDIKELTAEQVFGKMSSVEVSATKQNLVIWLVNSKIEPSRR